MAEALRCTQCGASLPPITPEIASVPCPACGVVNRVDGGLLEQLHGHARAVGEVDSAAAHAGEAAIMAELTASFGGGWAAAFVISWILAGFVAMPETPLASALALAIFVGPFVVMGLASKRRLARLRAEPRAGPQLIPVACPGCGGQTEFVPGEPVRACRYCSGALAADEAALGALIASARARLNSEARRATEQRWRLAAKQGRAPRTDLAPFLVFGFLGGVWVLASIAAAIRALIQLGVHGEPVQDPASFAAIQLVSLILLVAVGAPLIRRRRRRLRLRARLGELAAQSGATLTSSLDDLAEWLCEHWHGELSGTLLRSAMGYGLVARSSDPSWALSLAPVAHEDQGVERHLRLLIPGQPGARADALVERFEALGLRCTALEGGLLAELELPEERSVLRSLDGAREALEALVDEQGRLPGLS